jgi:lysyl-tRNA synthetase class II
MIWENKLIGGQKEIIILIQRIREAMRNFLNEEGFLEVDIPSIFPSKSWMYGGVPIRGNVINGYLCAVATPYIRRWLSFGKDYNLHKVYSMGKCYRDEKIDKNHYPCFENLALGILGEDYNFLMEFIPRLVNQILEFLGKDLYKNWNKIPYHKLLIDSTSIRNRDEFDLLEEYDRLTRKINGPTFVTELPVQIFGPAKSINNFYKERAEIFINGIEIGNISTFLTNYRRLKKWYSGRGVDFKRYIIEKEHLRSLVNLDDELVTTGAIGLSRLFTVLLDLDRVSETIAFPYF